MAMNVTLIKFGTISRKLRAEKGFTIADQSEALSMAAAEISEIETGRRMATIEYVNRFAGWVGANFLDQQELITCIRTQGNVVNFSAIREARGSRLYRKKINTLTPREIWSLRRRDKEFGDG